MEGEHLFGIEMERDMKEIITLERNKDMENITITTINGMKECGKMESNMDKAHYIRMAIKYIQEDGIMGAMKQWFHKLIITDYYSTIEHQIL